jgi:hypothetical protein
MARSTAPGLRFAGCSRAEEATVHIVHDDDTEGVVTPGVAYVIEPGHAASVVGDEPAIAFEFNNSTA